LILVPKSSGTSSAQVKSTAPSGAVSVLTSVSVHNQVSVDLAFVSRGVIQVVSSHFTFLNIVEGHDQTDFNHDKSAVSLC
jgi:hypothetical protein